MSFQCMRRAVFHHYHHKPALYMSQVQLGNEKPLFVNSAGCTYTTFHNGFDCAIFLTIFSLPSREGTTPTCPLTRCAGIRALWADAGVFGGLYRGFVLTALRDAPSYGGCARLWVPAPAAARPSL